MWVIFYKSTLSTHNPHNQSINLVYRFIEGQSMSHLFGKPTLSVGKPGLSNSIMWVSAINILDRPIM